MNKQPVRKWDVAVEKPMEAPVVGFTCINEDYVSEDYEPLMNWATSFGLKVPMIGEKVVKRSGKAFKSGLKINTVKGVVEHPYLENARACTFEEDDSFVWVGALSKNENST